MKKLCVVCGETFEASRKTQTFCSSNCRVKAHRLGKRMFKERTNNLKCDYCGEQIYGKRTGRAKKYCSPSCRTMAYRKRNK